VTNEGKSAEIVFNPMLFNSQVDSKQEKNDKIKLATKEQGPFDKVFSSDFGPGNGKGSNK